MTKQGRLLKCSFNYCATRLERSQRGSSVPLREHAGRQMRANLYPGTIHIMGSQAHDSEWLSPVDLGT